MKQGSKACKALELSLNKIEYLNLYRQPKAPYSKKDGLPSNNHFQSGNAPIYIPTIPTPPSNLEGTNTKEDKKEEIANLVDISESKKDENSTVAKIDKEQASHGTKHSNERSKDISTFDSSSEGIHNKIDTICSHSFL